MGIIGSLIGGLGNIVTSIPGVGSVASGLIGSVGDTASSAINAAEAMKLQKQEQKWSAEQAQLSRDWQTSEREKVQQFNLDMWNLNNEYNSPAEQLKRAQAAGINPNAVIGGDMSTPARAVTSSPMSGATASHPGSIASTMLTSDAVVSNLLAQAKKTSAEADNQKYDLTWNKLTQNVRYDILKKEFEKLDTDIKDVLSNTKVRDETFKIFSAKSEEELNILKKQAVEIGAQIDLLRQQYSIGQHQEKSAEYDADLKKLELDFCRESGIPPGTDLSAVIWRTVLNGQFPQIVDSFINAILDTVGSSESWFDRATGGFFVHKPTKDSKGRTSYIGTRSESRRYGLTSPSQRSIRNP